MQVLVAAAGRGDERAWSDLVGRYTPLVYSVINSYRVSWADAADVNQTVWLRLVEQLSRIRDPQALPLWLVTTTRNECLRALGDAHRTRSLNPLDAALDYAGTIAPTPVADRCEPADPSEESDGGGVDARLLAAERHQVLRDGLRQLPPRCRQLIGMLVAEPPLSYDDISARLGIPVGSIGPTRARCLDKLRGCPAVVAFRDAAGGTPDQPGGGRRDVATVG